MGGANSSGTALARLNNNRRRKLGITAADVVNKEREARKAKRSKRLTGLTKGEKS